MSEDTVEQPHTAPNKVCTFLHPIEWHWHSLCDVLRHFTAHKSKFDMKCEWTYKSIKTENMVSPASLKNELNHTLRWKREGHKNQISSRMNYSEENQTKTYRIIKCPPVHVDVGLLELVGEREQPRLTLRKSETLHSDAEALHGTCTKKSKSYWKLRKQMSIKVRAFVIAWALSRSRCEYFSHPDAVRRVSDWDTRTWIALDSPEMRDPSVQCGKSQKLMKNSKGELVIFL